MDPPGACVLPPVTGIQVRVMMYLIEKARLPSILPKMRASADRIRHAARDNWTRSPPDIAKALIAAGDALDEIRRCRLRRADLDMGGAQMPSGTPPRQHHSGPSPARPARVDPAHDPRQSTGQKLKTSVKGGKDPAWPTVGMLLYGRSTRHLSWPQGRLRGSLVLSAAPSTPPRRFTNAVLPGGGVEWVG